jgi:hypothetical protein
MTRTGLCSAHASTPSDYPRFTRAMGEHGGWRSSQCDFEPRYTQRPRPANWMTTAVLAVAGTAPWIVTGLLLGWRG